MRFIKDKKIYDQICNLANKGDEKACYFLSNFLEMEDDKVSEYLNSIESENSVNSVLNFLIQDEIDAIKGYTNAIRNLKEIGVENKELYSKLDYIIKDEQEHIDILKSFLNSGESKENGNQK